MATAGRNEPCPCGSGKKYKQCCMPKERAKQVRELTRNREDDLLWAQVLDYLDRPAFAVDAQSAFSRFWNGDFDLRTARVLDPPAMEAFLEWYAYDYPTSKERQRVVELFAAEEGPRLSAEQQQLLGAHSASYLSLYGIEQIDGDGRLQIGDLLVGGPYEVQDAGLARLAMPGDLLLGRRFTDEARSRLSRGTVLLPAAFGAELVGVAKRAFATYRDEHYQATWQDFLRESGYVMFHYLFSPEASDTYRRAAGRDGYFDPRPGVERLRKAMQLLMESRARAEAEEAKKSEPEAAPEGGPRIERTAGGILIPGQPKLPAEGRGGILLPGQVRR